RQTRIVSALDLRVSRPDCGPALLAFEVELLGRFGEVVLQHNQFAMSCGFEVIASLICSRRDGLKKTYSFRPARLCASGLMRPEITLSRSAVVGTSIWRAVPAKVSKFSTFML